MNLKVAMFSYYFPPQYSGSALQAMSLANALKGKGIDTFFFTVNHGGLPENDEVGGFKTYRLREGKGKFGELLLWKNMWNLLKSRKECFDIIHSHGAYLRNSFIGPLSKVLGKKSLVKVTLAKNDLYGLGNGKSGWLHKKFLSLVDKYISISGDISDELKGYGFPDKKIKRIPNGVDTKRFCPLLIPEKKFLRRKFRLPENSLMLLYVGVIDERKNVKGLIEMWSRFNSDYPGFLVIVGPTSRGDANMELYNALKTFEKKLEQKLFFIPYTEKVEDFYKMADIFILPSTNEGMPNVVLEAMSSGLPCFVNRASGTGCIDNYINGLFFDVAKEETFFDGLHKLRDENLRLKLSTNARKTALNNFHLEIIADRYISLYKEILKT